MKAGLKTGKSLQPFQLTEDQNPFSTFRKISTPEQEPFPRDRQAIFSKEISRMLGVVLTRAVKDQNSREVITKRNDY